MEPTEKDINELRSSFFKKCEDEKVIASGTFHQNDINRAKTDDDWLRRFLLHHDNDQKEALNMMMETCDWRKKFEANEISEKNVNQELLENGCVFTHGRDKDGKAILIFKSKKHIKGAHSYDDLHRHLVYWMERMERQEKGDMISIFFDMDGAGFSNMDTDYTKYIISLFKNYYPHFLNYIIIYEMAWILNAAFKLIKTWLPPKALKKIKFLNKSNLKEVIDPEQALRCWGGLSDYVFVFKSDERGDQQHTPVHDECKKKVHFADGSPVQDYMSESGFSEPVSVTPMSRNKLTISPPDVLPFRYEGDSLTGSIILKNEDVQCLSYKIKTTSPKKFLVRHSMGILSPEKSTTVTVVLQTGCEPPILHRDKFLIMSIPVDTPDMSSESLSDLWKNASEDEVSGYKLRCTLAQSAKTDGAMINGALYGTQAVEEQKLSKITSDVIKVQTTVNNLREDVKLIQRQQWIIVTAIVFLACIIAYISSGGGFGGFSRGDHKSCWVFYLFAASTRFLIDVFKAMYTYAAGTFRLYSSRSL